MTIDVVTLDREARRRAVLPAGSFIVQAPAGSGKTTLLTLRYLRLLADVERPEQIVAITFTRKAAAEMRHRIVAALAAAASPLAEGADERQRELHRHARAALERSAERGWGLEHNPARLHVQTIDGLNHWLARRLPLAARIGASAALIDDARALYAESARRTVARLDSDEPVVEGLLRLSRAVDYRPRQLATLIAGMLGQRELWLPKLLQTGRGAALRESIDRVLHRALESELAEVADRLRGVDWDPLFDICRRASAAGAPESPARSLSSLAGLPDARAEWAPAWRALADTLLRADKEPALLKQVGAKQGFLAAAEGPQWKALKREMCAFLESLAAGEAVAHALGRLRILPPARLTDAQWERIDALSIVLPYAVADLLALFAERDGLDHAAVAAAARDALGEEAAPTELALALDYRIRHLLIDEYQDTSPSQARLLELLIAGWQPGDGRSLFCVGDPMQSIYAFREADVTLFLQAQHQGIGGVPLAAERLGQNFRSSAPIVDWVNATFDKLLPATDDFERGAVRYSPAAAVKPEAPGDGVRVHALLDADESAMGAEIASIVRDTLAQLEKPSIAILVRGRFSLPPILEALRAAGVKYRGVELESLLDRSSMRDLLALLHALMHDGDRTAWLAVLRAPWCGLSLADLLTLAADASATLRERLHAAADLAPDPQARARRTAAVLEAAISARGAQPLGSWLKSCWLALDGPATVEDASDLVNAELLFGSLDRLERESGCRPQRSEIEAAVENVMASPVGSADARVQIMTIHRAKGLEFDVVVLPDLQRGARREDRPLMYWTNVATGPGERGIVLAGRGDAADAGEGGDALERWMRELGKERDRFELGRVAYVAATRAKRRLHLVGQVRTKVEEGGRVLKAPPETSLLGFLWPAVASHFDAALAARPAGDAAAAAARRKFKAPPAQRLAAEYRGPELPAPPRSPTLNIAGADELSIRPAFDWAGAIAQAVGQVVHQELQRWPGIGAPKDAGRFAEARWRRSLDSLGIDAAHQARALERIRRAMENIAASAQAARLLEPRAREPRAELALTLLVDGVAHGLRIDRTFVDEEGVRWIVDWKTSAHEGGDVESFLDRELERYRGQLERYVEAMKSLEPDRPIRAGLYFPLLDAWREL